MNTEDQRNRTSTACLVWLQPIAELVHPSLNEKTLKLREVKKLDQSHFISYETEQSAHKPRPAQLILVGSPASHQPVRQGGDGHSAPDASIAPSELRGL